MTLEEKISKIFKLDSDEAWLRHTNPWSAYSRFSMLPLLAISFWSRVWLGWWALVPIIIVLLWLWLNPRIFPRAKSTDNWASKAVLGERVWMNRKTNTCSKAPSLYTKYLVSGFSNWNDSLYLGVIFFGSMASNFRWGCCFPQQIVVL